MTTSSSTPTGAHQSVELAPGRLSVVTASAGDLEAPPEAESHSRPQTTRPASWGPLGGPGGGPAVRIVKGVTTTSGQPKPQIFDLLDAEWRRTLANDPSVARRLPELLELTGGRTLADVDAWIARAEPADADRALHLLVARAVEGDELAARVLLQRLLPGAKRLARRWWAIRDLDERAAITVSAVWTRIRAYPIARRPERIAANILLDAENDLRRTVAADGRFPECSGLRLDDERPHDADPHPVEDLLEVLTDAVATGVVSTADARLIVATRVQGTPLRAASADAVALRTLQWRRKRAESALVGTRCAA